MNMSMTSMQTPYWAGVVAQRAKIQGSALTSPDGQTQFFAITSVENAMRGIVGGVIFEVDLNVAAMRITEGTHRISTDAEYEAYKQQVLARAKVYKEIEDKRKNTSILQLSVESATQIGVATATAMAAKQKGDK